MTAIPSDLHPVDAAERLEAPQRNPLSGRATAYLLSVIALTVAVSAPFILDLVRGENVDGWLTFAILGTAAAIAQLFTVRFQSKLLSFHTSIVFLLAAALLLPPELVVLIGIVQNIPEWLKERYTWFVQSFNICNFTLNVLGAWAAYHLILNSDGLIASEDARLALGAGAACAVFVLSNHFLLASMLRIGRGFSFRETQLFSVESLSTDLVLASLGVALATFWTWNPWLIPVALSPLLVLHRSLSVPQLQAEARVDPKTGLYNARYFATALNEELARAARFNRPMSLIMADLDLLRDINNTYGHLAGDAVLKGIAEVFRAQLRHYDVPARFGGEEFSILLPETPPEQALEIAERIRRAVAEREYEVETSSEPIRATVSIGVAGFPKDAMDANELIHQADLAVYRAKLQGRNRVLGASAEPLLMPADRQRTGSSPCRRRATTASRSRPPPEARPAAERRHPRPHALNGPRFLSLSTRLSLLVGTVSVGGVVAGIARRRARDEHRLDRPPRGRSRSSASGRRSRSR